MMKNLKLWQKAGLVAAIVTSLTLGGLTLGGLTPKYSSKGLESKIPTISISTAEAKEVKTEGYEVPDLTGYIKVAEKCIDKDGDGFKETLMEGYKKEGEGYIIKYSTSKGTWAWGKLKSPDDPQRYAIVDSDCNGIFEERYGAGEEFDAPKCAK